MKKAAIIGGMIIASMLVGAGTTFALGPDYATGYSSYSPGTQKDGDPIVSGRDDPSEALGAPDGVFVSLGYGGELVLSFDALMGGELSLSTQEITGGTYPIELADVWVSADGIGYTKVGTASNEGGTGDGITTFDLVDMCVQYVKLVDTTDSSLHGPNSDGFDVDAVSAEYTEECQIEEPEPPQPSPNIVINHNEGMAMTRVEANANSGLNEATGARGGDAGEAGSVIHSGDDNRGGNAGSGGSATGEGSGGYVSTGNAQAEAGSVSVVNTNTTRLTREGCDCGGLDLVVNANRGMALTGVHANANTGLNRATGARGGDAGASEPDVYILRKPKPGQDGDGDYPAGSVIDSGDDNQGGAGGNGGDAGEGGTVVTGHALSRAEAVSMVNTNNTRIARTGSTPMIIYR